MKISALIWARGQNAFLYGVYAYLIRVNIGDSDVIEHAAYSHRTDVMWMSHVLVTCGKGFGEVMLRQIPVADLQELVHLSVREVKTLLS